MRSSIALVACVLATFGCRTASPEPASSASDPSAEPVNRPKTPDGYEIVSADPKGSPTEAEPVEPPMPKGLVLDPTEPDPRNGQFSFQDSIAGMPVDGKLVAEIRTDLGTVYCDLFADRVPNTVANFVGLARGIRPWWDPATHAWVTRPYYDGSSFHRVIPGFMIQGGGVLPDGEGGAGYEFPDELHPTLRHDRAGQLCMANHGANTNSAQFFITDGAAPHLDALKSFTIFGQCEPVDVVAHIARVPQEGPKNRPLTTVRIEAIRIRRAAGGASSLAKSSHGGSTSTDLKIPTPRGASRPPSELRGKAHQP